MAIRLKDWLKHVPRAQEELDMYARSRSSNLTLAGFALAAIALFLTLGFSTTEISINDVKETGFYLSVSIIMFITAAYLCNFSINRAYTYLAGSLEWLGLISVGISLLLFFVSIFPEDFRFLGIYGIFFIVVIILASIELKFWNNYIKSLNANNTK